MGPPGDTGSKGTEVSGLLKRGLLKLHVEFKKQKDGIFTWLRRFRNRENGYKR